MNVNWRGSVRWEHQCAWCPSGASTSTPPTSIDLAPVGLREGPHPGPPRAGRTPHDPAGEQADEVAAAAAHAEVVARDYDGAPLAAQAAEISWRRPSRSARRRPRAARPGAGDRPPARVRAPAARAGVPAGELPDLAAGVLGRPHGCERRQPARSRSTCDGRRSQPARGRRPGGRRRRPRAGRQSARAELGDEPRRPVDRDRPGGRPDVPRRARSSSSCPRRSARSVR